MTLVKEMILSSGGLGYAPVASGTFGTLGGVAVALLLQWVLPGERLALGLAAVAVVLFAVGVVLGPFAVARFGRKDPSQVVLDEVVGYLLTVAVPCAVGPAPGWIGHGLAFVLFRAADVVKPPPARQLEALPHGWGIMADDAVAGLMAGLVLLVVRLVQPTWL